MATKKEAAAKKATPKAAPKKAAEPAVSQEELLALGEEMNTLLFPGEEVNFSEMSAEEITAQIKADAENIDPKDQFSDDSKATLAAIGIEIEWATPAAAKKDAAAGKKAAAKKDAPAASEGAKKKGSATPGKGPGVIAKIVELCKASGKKGISKEEILEALTEAFPGRTADSMKATVNVQVPNRINKERDFNLEKKDGRYFVAK